MPSPSPHAIHSRRTSTTAEPRRSSSERRSLSSTRSTSVSGGSAKRIVFVSSHVGLSVFFTTKVRSCWPPHRIWTYGSDEKPLSPKSAARRPTAEMTCTVSSHSYAGGGGSMKGSLSKRSSLTPSFVNSMAA
eukprot:267104-Prymnesium_polylepis.2